MMGFFKRKIKKKKFESNTEIDFEKDPRIESKSKKEVKSEKAESNKKINLPVIRIVIKTELAQNLIQTVAIFQAEQIKDASFNLILVNDKFNFKEDYSLGEFQILETLRARLGSGSKEDKIDEIDKSIDAQRDKISLIRSGYYFFNETNLKKWEEAKTDKDKEAIDKQEVNLVDEEIKLKFFLALKDKLDFEGNGAYEEINLEGEKQITLLAKDGVFTPFFISTDNIGVYTDNTLKRKLFYDFTERNEELRRKNDGMTGWFWNAIKITLLVLIAVLIFCIFRVTEIQNDLELQREAQARFLDESYLKEFVEQNKGDGVSCAYYYTELMKMNGEDLMKVRDRLADITLDEYEDGKALPKKDAVAISKIFNN